ncbi:NAD(P)H-dependent oxidoreductase [Marivirga sp. S37H4]|uniref:NAD(P)H-dependent oxidoreductase n=1 Tax=Marivirga aurantiaca TaxID=2802615 RepID=A0A935CC52_9BACT|nr:NAD(P)H-dependent oxidoreductase [Marivirga aurantiaca]MBK6265768.1 NAD(P)H-dependent oxidoreductase [Marivirga aurantiaca]
MKTIIIQGSSRSNGNTSKIVGILRERMKCELIDLNSYLISQYNYEHKNRNDDFLKLMRKIVEYDLIIFATPVYWYSMSGLMKTFFDRVTDCLKIEKETGRKLRGKYMAAISCGSDGIETEGFFVPFKNSAEYLGMTYVGNLHTWIESDSPTENVLKLIAAFKRKLEEGMGHLLD